VVTAGETFETDRELDVAAPLWRMCVSGGFVMYKCNESNIMRDGVMQLTTMFWILKSVNLALKPSFWMMRAYLREASLLSSSLLAPVTTILPDAKISAVVFGSRIRMMTAAKRLGLYSALRACSAMVLRSRRQSRLTVATMFLQETHRLTPSVTSFAATGAILTGE
jgi:hypothetical protein